MKILILSTFGHYGGAATCSKRLYFALKKHGMAVDLRVAQFYDPKEVRPLYGDSVFSRLRTKLFFILDRLQALLMVRNFKYLYKFSKGMVGLKISEHPLIQEADIVHLHWVNFGFISIREIGKLARKKPVIWTQHDMWAFEGGFHYTCYQKSFGANPGSQRVLEAKSRSWSTDTFKLIATSTWLANSARQSDLFKDWNIEVLPTPIDTQLFRPLDKQEIRSRKSIKPEEFCVLFGAVDLEDERKGFLYLKKTLEILESKLPGIRLIVFGSSHNDVLAGKVVSVGQINSPEELNEIYNLADVFVQPSIQDNLPNTVMEALSVGVPVVAFDSGGVADMVDHLKNGFLAKNEDPNMLAEGILHFVDRGKRVKAGLEARKKIEDTFSEEVLVPKYQELYHRVLKGYHE